MAAQKMKLAVVIPFFRNPHQWYEEASVKQAIKVLGAYHHFVIVPNGFEIIQLKNWYINHTSGVSFIAIPNEHFESLNSYNRLLLSQDFYSPFADYDYMLIYQTDAWIFRDNLAEWMGKGYDYIGAPWVNNFWAKNAARQLTWPRRILGKLGYSAFNYVGNGGLSLRKIDAMIFNLKFFKFQAKKFIKNEDYFFSFFITSFNPFFKIPSTKNALKFAFDENPGECFEVNLQRLPMGCHAWQKHIDFWNKYILIDQV